MRRTICLKVPGRWILAAAAVVATTALLAAAGCEPSPAITVVRLGPGDKGDIQGDVVKMRRGGREAFEGLRGGFYVIRSVEDWRNAWPGGAEPPLPSTLDPSRSMVLLAVADKPESVAVKITKVLETGDRIHVWVKDTRAGENCTTKLERTPSDAVVTQRLEKPVKFYVDEERAESCGEPPAVNVSCRAGEAPKWADTLLAQPGETIECAMTSSSRGRFALVDNVLLLRDLPGGSSAKLAYSKGPARGSFAIDVFGKYTVHAEATDESGRRSSANATIDVLPPKTKDVLVQLVWTNFDVSDDPDTFPRVKLRATEERKDAKNTKNRPPAVECSLDKPRPELCDVKTRSAYTQMRVWASGKRIPLDVLYVDERIEKGPLVCVQVYFDGVRSGETCDRQHRDPEERWQVGTIEMETGKLIEPAAALAEADGGAPDGGDIANDAGVTKALPPRIPAPKLPAPPTPTK